MLTFLSKHPRLKHSLLIAALVFVLFLIVRDFLIKKSVQVVATRTLGAPVTIGHLSLSILFQKIQIRNLKIYNPPGFPSEAFLDMPEIVVDLDAWDALKGRWHFPLIVMSLKELIVIRNKDGKLNVDSLKIVVETLKKEKDKKEAEKDSTNGAKDAQKQDRELNFQIDVLKLNADRVIVKDFSKGEPPVISVYDLKFKNKAIKNINGLPQLAARVLIEAMKPTAIRKAGIYAATSLMGGVGFLPAAAFGVIIAKDDATSEINLPYKKVYNEAVKLAETIGTIKKTEQDKGKIFAKVYGCDVLITLEQRKRSSVLVKIQARKFLLARPQIAAGLLYQLIEQLQ